MHLNENKGMKINWITTSVLVFYPVLLLGFVGIYLYTYGAGWAELIMAMLGYYVANISVGLGFHRLWSHSSYKTHKWIELILALTTAGTLQGPVLAWASDHQRHHAYADTENDPHTPLKFKDNVFKGLFWSHIGWMLVGESSYKHLDRATLKRLGSNKILLWQLKYYWQLATAMNTVVPFLIGYFFGGTIQAGIAGYLFIGLGRALQQQMTFCVNSLCHFIGSSKYANDSSRDIWWLFFLLLGENWHNFHHAFARDYRNGWKWYQLDVHKWLIYAMGKLGLAWDLVSTPIERIKAKQNETEHKIYTGFKTRLEMIEKAAHRIAETANEKLALGEKSAMELADNLKVKLRSIESAARQLSLKAHHLLHYTDGPTERLVVQAVKKFNKLEDVAIRLGIICQHSLQRSS